MEVDAGTGGGGAGSGGDLGVVEAVVAAKLEDVAITVVEPAEGGGDLLHGFFADVNIEGIVIVPAPVQRGGRAEQLHFETGP